jgi:N-acetyl-anhydromuramoyl-L-alanine amidase
VLEWLNNARRVISPNVNDRPCDASISLLVIHNISLPSGEFGGEYIEDFFCNRLACTHPYFETISTLKVSAHVLIRRDGEVVQFAPFSKRAWHAGISVFEGRENCNDYSVGIELEGTDDLPYETAQYAQLVKATKLLMSAFPAITLERIVGHSDVAPGRKTDPGSSFDWVYYRQQLMK